MTAAGVKRPLQDCGVAEFLMDDGFETEFTSALLKDEDFVARINSRVPLRRWERPHDLAGAAYLPCVRRSILRHRTAVSRRWRLECHHVNG